jgi:hypothetical protein
MVYRRRHDLQVRRALHSDELARRIGRAWEKLPEPRHAFSLEVIAPERPSIFGNLGPHPPRLRPEDVDRVHEMWLDLSDDFGSKLHHRDVVGVALRRMARELDSHRRTRSSKMCAGSWITVAGLIGSLKNLVLRRLFLPSPRVQ